MKNKLISFVLVLVMILGCAMPVMAFSDTATSTHKEAIETLSGLGLIKGYGNDVFGPNDTVTRAQMATFLVRALGINEVPQTATKFNDVPATHWASGYIAYATDLGIIYGYGEGKFGPDDKVTYEQAVTMIMRALGYSEAHMKDLLPAATYPGNYLIIAQTMKLTDKLDNKVVGYAMSRENVAQAIYNALEMPICVFNKDGENINASGDTFLARQNATYTKSMYTFNADAKANLIDAIGQYGYVITDKNNDVIGFNALSTSLVGKYVDGKFVADKVKYSVNTSATFAAIVNGMIYGETTISAITNEATLNVELSGTTIKKIYSVNIWEAQKEVKLVKGNLLKDAKFAGYNCAKDEDGNVNNLVMDINGIDKLSDAEVGMIATIYCYGKTGNIVRVDFSNAVIEGVVTQYSPVDGYGINGVNYKLADGVSLTLGSTYKCYLNAEGKIAKAELVKGTESKNYAIYVGSYKETFGDLTAVYYTVDSPSTYVRTVATTTGALTKGALFTFTTSNGKMNSVTLASTASSIKYTGRLVTIDGTAYRMSDDIVCWTFDGEDYATVAISTLEKNSELVSGSACQYMLNNNGEVRALLVGAGNTAKSNKYVVINESGSKWVNNASVNYIEGLVSGAAFYSQTDLNVPSVKGLYQIKVAGSKVTEFTYIVPTVSVVIDDIDDNFVKASSIWYALDENMVVYCYNADDKKFSVNENFSVDDTLYLYDFNSDGIYDLAIWTPTV